MSAAFLASKWLPVLAGFPLSAAIEVETYAGKIHVEWDPRAAVTPIGQLAFFIEFLKLGRRFSE